MVGSCARADHRGGSWADDAIGCVDAITPALTALGFRVLSYDLYGRGYSDAPFRRHTLDFNVQQLDELLTFLKVK